MKDSQTTTLPPIPNYPEDIVQICQSAIHELEKAEELIHELKAERDDLKTRTAWLDRLRGALRLAARIIMTDEEPCPNPPTTALNPGEWHDISTAPRNGTFVDLWSIQRSTRYPEATYLDIGSMVLVRGWYRMYGGVPVLIGQDKDFSHWMMIPKGPYE